MTKKSKELSVQELEELLAEKKKAQTEARQKEEAAYVADRDKKIDNIIRDARKLSQLLNEFKQGCHKLMDDQQERLDKYGAIRGNSKGGFSITNSEGSFRIIRRRDTEPSWDERANKGLQLVKDFLHECVKKRDRKLFEILMSFLERNKEGELEYAKVMHLLKHEDKFDDPKWKEGLTLIKEGYMISLKAYGYEFKIKQADGKWGNVILNFSAL